MCMCVCGWMDGSIEEKRVVCWWRRCDGGDGLCMVGSGKSASCRVPM